MVNGRQGEVVPISGLRRKSARGGGDGRPARQRSDWRARFREPTLTRRDLLALIAGACTLPAMVACALGPWQRQLRTVRPDLPAGAIDTHCHVFNASDLSVGQFMRRVVLRDYEDTISMSPVPDPEETLSGVLADFITSLLARSAPTAQQESEMIRRGEPVEAGDADETRQDRQILREVLGGLEAGGAPMPPPPGRQTRVEAPLVVSQGTFLEEILLELRAEGLAGPEEAFLVDDIVDALLGSAGRIGRHVRWALLLLKPRRRIVAELMATYGGKGGITLFTPALVDFTHWLDEFPRSPFVDQVYVMDLIQRRQDGPTMLHGFVPFNPLHQLVAETENRTSGETPLDLVKHAVMEAGFVGVKLYPPMGFLPTDNQRHEITVPERFKNFPSFQVGLDQTLDDLYAWCRRHDVSIMAHTTNSNPAVAGAGVRAHPAHWARVLDRHPSLRLNLAHFGGFDNVLRAAATLSVPPSASWEHAVGELLNAGRRTVYADLSYLHEHLGRTPDTAELARLRSLTREYIHRFDPVVEHLVYGSDWIMLAREFGHTDYVATIADLLDALGLDVTAIERVFKWNAVRYLGLGSGEKTRQRLEYYYRRHRLDADRLRVFDDVPVS